MNLKELDWRVYVPGMLAAADRDKFFWFKKYGYLLYINIMINRGVTVHLFHSRSSKYCSFDGFTSRDEAVALAMEIHKSLDKRDSK